MLNARLDDVGLTSLEAAVGVDAVFTDKDTCEQYGRDWTRFHEPAPSAIVFPRSTEQVRALVKFANDSKVALVPSGGRTGLSAGAVATNGEVVVSFDKMNQVLDFDEVDRTVTVQPGLITANLQAFASEHALYYPVDFASAGSSQIGGNIATNAGGIKVLRYGLTRQWVAGLKVVTGRGDVLELNRGLVKNATGYDLRHLFVGSEGTLGLIVEATMRLTAPPKPLSVMLLAVPNMIDTISILTSFQSQVPLTAFEFFSDAALSHVTERMNIAAPFSESAEFYVLLEFENDDELQSASAGFERCLEKGWVTDGVIGQSEQQNQDLWRFREHISEAITPMTPYKNDVAVRTSLVPAFLADVQAVVDERYPDFQVVWFGHIGDGNLHLNILKPAGWSKADFKQRCEQVSHDVLAIVQKFGGSISAEHGVGLLKREQLGYTRSSDEIDLMRQMKSVFDPNGIMNPGKLIA